MDKLLITLREKVSYILNHTTLVVDSSSVFDFFSQGLWPNLQESVPTLASTGITVGEWERNAPISTAERTMVMSWEENLQIEVNSTTTVVNPQELPNLKLTCGVRVYPAQAFQENTTHSMSRADRSQIGLVRSLQNYGQAAALLSTNHTQVEEIKHQVWNYKFILGLLVSTESLSVDDTRIDELIKEDKDWDSSFNYKDYMDKSFPAKVEEAYKKVGETNVPSN